jgi:predicted AlkP superfamily phosphohydrolase/phosphomutase
MNKKIYFLILFIFGTFTLSAYVGPGAGFAFAGSFLFVFIAFFLAIFNFLTFPFRTFFKFIKRLSHIKDAKFKKVIVIGYDGMDFKLLSRFIREGRDLPNFKKLSEEGTFAPLLSTEPPISPVAWSTFSTGVNPGKHNIFDFLSTNRNNYMPELSCSEILPPKRTLKFNKYVLPISKPKIELKRKSKTFWKLVSERGIFASVLRVPYTFPPEKFYGVMISGLGTPDLRGSQGSSTSYSAIKNKNSEISDSISEKLTELAEGLFEGSIEGPENPFLKTPVKLRTKFRLRILKDEKSVELELGGDKIILRAGILSSWNKIEFKAGFVKIRGIAQFYVKSIDPLKLYLSPINIDPENPSMPISHPKIFSVYLSKLLGPYATLGMAEDNWALEEDVITEEAYIDQTNYYQKERERTFFNSLKKYKTGLIVQVFEATDRIQHMFWRYFKDSGSKAKQESNNPKVVDAIFNVYKEMDILTGEILEKIGKKELLMIVSDHGFNTVRREFDLNSWLKKEGYIVLKENKKTSGKWYADVDWNKSKLYGQGLNGLYLNLKNREKQGIVEKEDAEALKDEVKNKLLAVVDPDTGEKVFKIVYKREEVYKGPYVKNAADIVLGYNVGYRVSWESAVNFVGERVHKDSTRLWSGDHCFSNKDVQGIFFSNHKILEKNPRLLDISPSILAAFGIKKPAFIEGNALSFKEGLEK